MPIWRPAEVEEEPEIALSEWAVFEVVAPEPRTRHFVGLREDGTGRVSSPIKEFDGAKMTGRTSSGRRYKLVGPPVEEKRVSLHPQNDAMFVWGRWSLLNKVEMSTEVTSEYWWRRAH